tara:strand:- start:185 stop:5989 length:5805 start_codon:yes stop_codon:yes gene_type:complete
MAKCPNKNTAEYIALLEVYKTDLITTNVINSWQESTDSDAIPTTVEAASYVRDKKALNNLKQKEFGQAVLNNLSREKIIHSHQGAYYINNTDQDTLQISDSLIASNVRRAKRYLQANNLPADSLNIEKTPKTYAVSVNSNLFTAKDMLPQSRSWDTPRARQVVKHLMRMFPDVSVKLLTPTEAKKRYDLLPQWRKAKVPFAQVNSFYIAGNAILIKGRVTDEIAIEEMLHPFIEAVKLDNIPLYETLLDESKRMFPVMTQQIEDAYNKKRNITAEEREMEVVTQALSRHFNKEYEERPTQSFLNSIEELLKWFKNIIENLNQYITGRKLPVQVIKSDLTLSDIAKLLNTSGISFETGKSINGRVRYNLTPEKQSLVNQALKSSRTDQQKTVINEMFHNIKETDVLSDSLSANTPTNFINNLVVLNKDNNTFYDINTREAYQSANEVIGKTDKFSTKIKNDISIMVDAIASYKTFEEISESLSLDKDLAKAAYDRIKADIVTIKNVTDVILTNVIFSDPKKEVAAKADIVLIDKFGNLKIIKVNTINSDQESGYDDVLVPLESGNRLKNNNVTELPIRVQDAIEINLIARMATNMGYKIDMDPFARSTINIQINDDLSALPKLEYQSIVPHNEFDNAMNVDFLIPETVYNVEGELLDQKLEEGGNDGILYDSRKDVVEDALMEDVQAIDPNDNVALSAVFGAIKDYRVAIVTREEMLDKVKSNIYMERSKAEAREQIANTLAVIDLVMLDPDNNKETAQAFTTLLQDSLRQMKEYKDYITNPDNIKEETFINYVLGFDRFMSTFEGLYNFKNNKGLIEELNATQRYLINNINAILIELNGPSSVVNRKTDRHGLVNRALFDYAEEVYRANMREGGDPTDKRIIQDHSGMTFTLADFQDLLTMAPDISNSAYYTKDLATSKDAISSTIDKVYKSQMQKVLTNIATRDKVIIAAAEKLRLIQPGVSKDRLYDFMLNFDENGVLSADNIVEPLGLKFREKRRDLFAATQDEGGVPLLYENVTNLKEAQKTEEGRKNIEFNIALSKKKTEITNFMRGEIINDEGQPIDGDYHRYTQQFKDIRNVNEVWNPKTFSWEQRSSISKNDYIKYRAKYYRTTDYVKAFKKKINGEFVPTGQIKKDQTFPSVKNKYIEPRLIARPIDPKTGKPEDMRSQKYIDIMDPKVNDALSVARREYYDVVQKVYVGEMLSKLPQQTRQKMDGQVPLVRSNIAADLRKNSYGGLFTRLWAKSGRGIKNLFSSTTQQKSVVVNELGERVDSMPIFFTGSPRVEKKLNELENRITKLKEDYKSKKIKLREYNKKRNILEADVQKQRSQPTLGEISTDLTDSLLQFNRMAEHFETMGAVEDTINALIKVLEKRSYIASGGNLITGMLDKVIPEKWNIKGEGGNEGLQKNVVRRARMWQKMVLYDNAKDSKGFWDKFTDALISVSSLSYVAFNPFGNINNLVLGQINNTIEGIGGRFFSRNAYLRAEKEFNTEGMAGIIKRTAMYGVPEVVDVVTLGGTKFAGRSYNPNKPTNKYEGTNEFWRMMDDSQDIRESGRESSGSKTIWERFKAIGYTLQDGFEYAVQTKIGSAVLFDTQLFTEDGGESTSIYDAGVWDTVKKEVTYPKKWTRYVPNKITGIQVPLNGPLTQSSKAFADIRNEIREVNKQTHGNYARIDRTVAQNYFLGQLIFQFHKWFPPAMRARGQEGYYDQNLGWMEGRYRSTMQFLIYATKQSVTGKVKMGNIVSEYKESIRANNQTDRGGEIAASDMEALVQNKVGNINRTVGEASMIILSMMMMSLLDTAWDDDDSDEPMWVKKIKNFSKYQTQRTYKEMVMFVPISPDGIQELFAMIGSPIASTRTLGELAEAFSVGLSTLVYGSYYGFDSPEFREDSDLVYQNKPRKGDLKFWKNLSDAAPILSTLQKWKSFEKLDSWYIAN